MTLTEMIDRIKNGHNIIYSRFGDGEWACILGKEGGNCDGHEYFADMGEELAKAVQMNNAYDVAIHGTARLKEEMFAWCWENGMRMNFSLTEIFHQAFVGNDECTIEQFTDALYKRRDEVLLVGPKHTLEMGFDQVVIPEKNCWLHTDDILAQIVKWLPTKKIVLFCAGMPACVWIDRMYHANGYSHTLIDVGSAFDPLCGVDSRSFHRRMRNKKEETKIVIPPTPPEPKKTLAILIPTLRSRKSMLNKLVQEIISQISAAGLNQQIEVIKDIDDGETRIGDKRNRMIDMCVGKYKYVQFVDDDDDVPENFIETIYPPLKQGDYDCVTFHAEVSVNGNTPSPYIFNQEHKEYSYQDGVYYRPPGHLCPIKTSIASQHKFGSQERGSDVAWSLSLVKNEAIKTSKHIPETLYFYNRTLVQHQIID